ncbi:hypothetical protein VHUM_01846 [Vanrija humicola]|uniref:Phosducin thioredoxin-like domain-containing protein n=1 Tax=Vanrija humicola TaxID=5417 RepID=A0A7D8Z085_VANHU|nr:hypothetical protein VHUM_01846 [Vanrija humicola]
MRASRPYADAAPRRAGAPQTGPKGVVEDQRAAAAAAAARAQRDGVRATRAAQERAAITAPTVHDEADARLAAQLADASLDDDGRERWRAARLAERGLREVGKESFVAAVERRGWVVVLIYEPLLAETIALARGLPRLDAPLSLVRARASQLAFSLLPPAPRAHSDNYDDDDEEDEEARPDPDVLPTMLVYRDGELERTWVRVDFDLQDDGVEGLLRR